MAVRSGHLAIPNLRNWSQLKEKIMVGVTLKDRKSTIWIRKQSGMTDIIRNTRESKHRWVDHVARMDNQSQNGYPVDINDLEVDQERDGAMI